MNTTVGRIQLGDTPTESDRLAACELAISNLRIDLRRGTEPSVLREVAIWCGLVAYLFVLYYIMFERNT